MSFKPLYDRIIIEPKAQEEKTAGGIFIPESAKEKPAEGKVVAVGDGYRNENGDIKPLKVKTGDVVVFGKWSGTEVKLGGKDYIVVKEQDILLIK